MLSWSGQRSLILHDPRAKVIGLLRHDIILHLQTLGHMSLIAGDILQLIKIEEYIDG